MRQRDGLRFALPILRGLDDQLEKHQREKKIVATKKEISTLGSELKESKT